MKKMKIELEDSAFHLLERLAAHSGMGQQELVEIVIYSLLDGVRRPGSWERSLIDSLGLDPRNQQYHQSYDSLLAAWGYK